MKVKRLGAFAASICLAALVAACEGLFTGESVARFALAPAPGGGFAPLRVTLGPEMNPLALNLAGEIPASAGEAGKWNTYRATLSYAGKALASNNFTVNNTGTEFSQSVQVMAKTMLILDVTEIGDYDLSIEPVGPVLVTVNKAQLELRKKIVRPQTQ